MFSEFFNLYSKSESGLTNICLSYAYCFSTSEPEYAYKRYAYKKTHVFWKNQIIKVAFWLTAKKL